MNLFIIRHKATGKLMPARSNTWWDPEKDSSVTPRIFARLVDAKNAKRYWEGGPLMQVYEQPSGPDWIDDGNSYLERSKEYGLERRPDDLEILEATLTIKDSP